MLTDLVAADAASPAAALARLTPGLHAHYATQLPELCVPCQPAAVPQPRLQVFNAALARELGWPAEALNSPLGAQLWAGLVVPLGAQPVAQGYAGHQFGGYSPQLGDGRALLLGEVRDTAGRLRDVAFKGSGRTPFSRGGDGKAALGPMLREYLVSEALHALGVPTTRSLAVAGTGETIWRDSGPLPGAVLTRVAASHIRVGTLQWVAARGDVDLLRRLADFALARHDPQWAPAAPGTAPHAATPAPADRHLALLNAVCERQAALVAQWMGLGFIHGVMNTDNMTLSGETIDYGPCAFMEAFDPDTVFSSIDRDGRYAWGNQPGIAQWNLARLAEALLPLLDPDADRALDLAHAAIGRFADLYRREWLAVMRAKLGLQPSPDPLASDDQDLELIQAWLAVLQSQGADWTLAHRQLSDGVEALFSARADTHAETRADTDAPLQGGLGLAPSGALNAWRARWQARLCCNPSGQPADWAQALRRTNPLYIPRNQPLEDALSAASEHGNLAPFHALLAAVQQPFDEVPAHARYAQPAPTAWAARHRTFCGT